VHASAVKTVGIVIPTFNEERNLERLLKSIRNQTDASYTIVVVDQGSTDATKSIARSYGCMVVEIKRPVAYIPWISAPLPANSRNLGAQSISGEILLHLDADMELGSSDLLFRLTSLLDDGHRAAVIAEADAPTGFWASCKALERSFYHGTRMEAARAVSRQLFEAVGGYDGSVSSGEDYIATRRYERETTIARDNSLLIIHHTDRLALRGLLRKKFVYGRTARLYLRTAKAIGGRSGSSIARASFGAWLRNWRAMLVHPVRYPGVMVLRALEFGAFQFGMCLELVSPGTRHDSASTPGSLGE
jgi:glycosyltransferase involved in cell wall biosynthesis